MVDEYRGRQKKREKDIPVLVPSETWRGIVIAPEQRCSPYSSEDYSYPQSVEQEITDQIGQIYGPYTGMCFSSIRETDIEHIVARSEAHDSGLCAANAETRQRFSGDLLNMTLASPQVNRHSKSDKDAAAWMPELNECSVCLPHCPSPPQVRTYDRSAGSGYLGGGALRLQIH